MMNTIAVQTVEVQTNIAETQTFEIEELAYSCFYCGEKIHTKSNLGKHRADCHDTYLDESYRNDEKCEKFESREPSSFDLICNNHIWGFPPLPPLPFTFQPAPDVTCFTCNQKMNFKSELKRHISLLHPEIVIFWCETCFMNFKIESELKSHMRNYHKQFSQ